MIMRRPSAVHLVDDTGNGGSAALGSSLVVAEGGGGAAPAAPRPVSPDRFLNSSGGGGGDGADRGRSNHSNSDSETNRHSTATTEQASSSLPSTHNPNTRGSQAPAAIPMSSGSEPSAPGSGVFVKRKVKKGGSQSSSTGGDAPLPSDRRNKSPSRTYDDGSSGTPRQQGGFLPRSILRNPTARHSTITFSADVVGITMAQIEAVPLLKKADVEQQTLRDEVFATLSGPVVSKEQITMNIAGDDTAGSPNGASQGIRIEGIIDHLRNMDEQNAVIRRLADFLHSANVFARSLAPFYALSFASLGDKTVAEAAQRILVREARINDVPIKTVAPSSDSAGNSGRPGSPGGGGGAQRSTGPMTTPAWDPDFHKAPPTEVKSQALAKFEERRQGYQASMGILNPRSVVSIPTPHHGRWERAAPSNDFFVVPDRSTSAIADGGEGTSSSSAFPPRNGGGLNETPRDHHQRRPLSTPNSQEGSNFDGGVAVHPSLPPSNVPPRTLQATYYGVPQVSATAPAPRMLYRDPTTTGYGSGGSPAVGGYAMPGRASDAPLLGGAAGAGPVVYRTRQYVVDEPGRIRGTY